MNETALGERLRQLILESINVTLESDDWAIFDDQTLGEYYMKWKNGKTKFEVDGKTFEFEVKVALHG